VGSEPYTLNREQNYLQSLALPKDRESIKVYLLVGNDDNRNPAESLVTEHSV